MADDDLPDDLLDGILGETAIRDAAAAAKADAAARAERDAARAEREAARDAETPEDPADRARRLDSSPDDGIERSRRAYTIDPRHNILGLTVGRRFSFHDSGDELDGEWVVAKIEDDGSRLYASRDGKTPPFIQIDEDVVREELGNKRLRPL